MDILVDATVMEEPCTGIAKVVQGLYTALLSLRADCRVTALHRRVLQCCAPLGIQSERRGRYFTHRMWRNLTIPGAAARRRPDIIHFPSNGHIPALLSGPLVVTTLHDVLPLTIPGYFLSHTAEMSYRRRVQRDLRRTDILVTDSEFSQKQIMDHFTVRSEPEVIYPGTSLAVSVERRTVRPEERGKHFLYVGGYDRRKGLEPLLRVFLDLHMQGKINCPLVLVGTVHYFSDSFQTLVQQGKDRRVVEEKGYVPDDQLADLLRGAIALIYPSRYEGFGLPPLEAMTIGCPVVTVRESSLPEVCGEAALYVDPDDARFLGETLAELERSSELRNSLTQKGILQARKFSWDVSAKRFLAVVDRELSRRRV